MAELSRSYLLLSAIEGDPVYGDRSEHVMFNSFPANHTADMKALHYRTAVNLPAIDSDRRDYYNPERMLEYVTGEMYRCCLYNSGKGWPTYVQHMILGPTVMDWPHGFMARVKQTYR